MVIQVTNGDDLGVMNQNVHDLWVDVEALSTMTDCGTLTIPLFAEGQLRDQRGFLTVNHVRMVDAEDTQGIGGYNIGKLEYSCPHRLRFVMNIPCKCQIEVKTLDLTLRLFE
jgi:hypothetical protein